MKKLDFKITNKSGQAVKIDQKELRNLLNFALLVFVAVFCLFGSKNLLSKITYQQRVLNAAHQSNKQLTQDVNNAGTLVSQYSSLFENSNPANAIGGVSDSSANAVPPNVDNARLALDAMPVTYDYPALVASVTKMLTSDGVQTPNIAGTDQTGTVSSQPSVNPQPVQISLTITGNGSYSTVKQFLTDLERSIRPFDVSTLQLAGSETNLKFTANVNTYFQPAKVANTTSKAVK